MADYRVLMVNPDQLDDSPTQPDSRVSAVGPMNHLKTSIREVGLQYPPLVLAQPGDRYQVIDGHRRIAAMNSLSYPKIPVLVTHGRPSDLFAAVSGNVAKMKATEWISVHLKGGTIPSGPSKSCIHKLETSMGRGFLERLEARRASPSIWNLANRVIKYCGFQEESRAEVLEYLMVADTREIAAWITGGNNIEVLRQCVAKGTTPSFRDKTAA